MLNCLFIFLVEALSRSEINKAELELEINRVKTEEASLRDALLKMQALNEGLGQDKIELNKIIMQVCLYWNMWLTVFLRIYCMLN